MPTMVRWFVKTGLAYFVASLLVGLAIVARPLLDLPIWISNLTPVYFHLFMVGWVTQLIFGVSIWMFPSHPGENRFGNVTMIWWTYGTLNAGLLLRAVAEPMVSVSPAGSAGPWLAVSAMLQFTAGLLYVINIWPRVKEK
jgi:hypothetical protein